MRKKMAAALAVMAVSAVFKTAVEEIRSMTIAPSGTEYSRPITSGALSAWLGQRTAATAESDSMLIPASVEDVRTHIQSAVELIHPLHKHGSRLPPDVQDAPSGGWCNGELASLRSGPHASGSLWAYSHHWRAGTNIYGEKECPSTSGP